MKWSCSVLSVLLAVSALAENTGEVRVASTIAQTRGAPAVARACLIEFDGRRPVGNQCSVPCYFERWEGRVLVAENVGSRTIWVSYVYQDGDGRFYESACQEIPAGAERSITDQSVRPGERRLVLVGQLPGPGYSAGGLSCTCNSQRRVIEHPPDWVHERWSRARAYRSGHQAGPPRDQN